MGSGLGVLASYATVVYTVTKGLLKLAANALLRRVELMLTYWFLLSGST